MIRETTGPSLTPPAAARLFRPAVSFVVFCLLTTGCTQPNAAQTMEQRPPLTHEEGVVRIQDASRQIIEVEEVSGARSDSTVAAPARIDFRDGAVRLSAGEMFVVPKGVEHKPYAEHEVKLLLIEPRGVRNTGHEGGERTAENDVWI